MQQTPQKPLLEDLDLPPNVDEIKTVIKEMNGGKTQAADGIPAELYKAIGTAAFKAFHDILVSIWEEECIDIDIVIVIVMLYTNKGAKSDCENYRGISLLSISGKILACILLNRLITSVSESNLPEARCDFRPGRSAIDMFAVRQDKKSVLNNSQQRSSVDHPY